MKLSELSKNLTTRAIALNQDGDYALRDLLREARNVIEKCHEKKLLTTGDTIRMPNYETAGGFRVWKIIGTHLGGLDQESTFELSVLDALENEKIQVPCVMLELHPLVEKC